MEDAVEDPGPDQRSANPTDLGRNYWARSQIASLPKPEHNNGERSMTTEVLEGYAVDLACLRKYPQARLAERARVHTLRADGALRREWVRPDVHHVSRRTGRAGRGDRQGLKPEPPDLSHAAQRWSPAGAPGALRTATRSFGRWSLSLRPCPT